MCTQDPGCWLNLNFRQVMNNSLVHLVPMPQLIPVCPKYCMGHTIKKLFRLFEIQMEAGILYFFLFAKSGSAFVLPSFPEF